jgi:hypothetical protein
LTVLDGRALEIAEPLHDQIPPYERGVAIEIGTGLERKP